MSRDELPIPSIERELHWASVLARLGMGSLFLSAAIVKVPNGIEGTIAYYGKLFEKSLLPSFLVTAHASVIMFVEFIVGFWLWSGYRLSLAWKVAGVLLVSLAVGMVFAGKYDVAADNYGYLVLAIGGLLVSRFDRWTLPAGERGQSRKMVAMTRAVSG